MTPLQAIDLLRAVWVNQNHLSKEAYDAIDTLPTFPSDFGATMMGRLAYRAGCYHQLKAIKPFDTQAMQRVLAHCELIQAKLQRSRNNERA